MPQGRPSLDDIYRGRGAGPGPAAAPPGRRPTLDDVYGPPRSAKELIGYDPKTERPPARERGALGRAWDWANTAPEFIAAPARQFAEDVTAPTLNRGPIESWLRGFAGGAIEGVSSLFSPANVVGTATGLAGAKAGAAGLTGLSRILRGADVSLAAPMAVEGAGRVLDDPTSGSAWAELGGGALATALGARATPPRARGPRGPSTPIEPLSMAGGQRQFSIKPRGPLTAQEALTAAEVSGERLTPGPRMQEGYTPGLGGRTARLGEGRTINEPLRPRMSPDQVRDVLEAPLAERLTPGPTRSLDDIYGAGATGRPASLGVGRNINEPLRDVVPPEGPERLGLPRQNTEYGPFTPGVDAPGGADPRFGQERYAGSRVMADPVARRWAEFLSGGRAAELDTRLPPAGGGAPPDLPPGAGGAPPVPRTPPAGPDWPGGQEIAGTRSALAAGQPSPFAKLMRFFGLEQPEAPIPPRSIDDPAVPSMTRQELLRRLEAGEPIEGMPGGQRFADLPPDQQRELRRMVMELDEFPFQRGGSTAEVGGRHQGRGGYDEPVVDYDYFDQGMARGSGSYQANPDYPNLRQVTSGTPIFHDIMQGRSGTRQAARQALQRFLEGGRPTSLTERGVNVAQRSQLGGISDRGRLPVGAGDVDVPPGRTVASGAETGAAATDAGLTPPIAPAAEAGGAGGPVHPRIRELWEKLLPKWRETVAKQAGDDIPFVVDPSEELGDFARRIREAPIESLWSKERAIRKIIDEGGFITPELAQMGAGAIAGGAGGAAVAGEQGQNPWLGAGAGALAGGAGMSALRRLFRSGGGQVGRSRAPLAAGEMPPRSTLSRLANMGRNAELRGNGLLPADSPRGGSSVELIDPDASTIRQNASGAPGAGSLEEMGRARANAAAGRQWVVYDRAGQRRVLDPLVGQDYQVRPGESFGLEGPGGFQLHDDLGGRYPKGTIVPAPRLGDAASRPGFDPTGRSTVELGAPGEGGDPLERAIRGLDEGEAGYIDPSAMGEGARKFSEGAERLGYFSMLGHPSTLAKGHLGAGSALFSRVLEEVTAGRPGPAAAILKAATGAGPRAAYGRALREGSADPTATRWGATAGPLGLPSRLMAAPDAFVTEAMIEAGVPLESAKQSAFTAEPRTKTGKSLVDFQRSLGPIGRTVAFPFARTAVGITERGLERTPGLGLLMELLQPASTRSAGRDIFARQALGTGVAAGAYALTGSNDEEGMNPWALTALGPYAVPAAIGQAIGRSGRPASGRVSPSARALREIAGATLEQSPLPTEGWQVERLMDPRTWPGRFVPRGLSMFTDPGAYETPGVLDPTIARIPWLNERMLDPRARGRGRGSLQLPPAGRPLAPVGGRR